MSVISTDWYLCRTNDKEFIEASNCVELNSCQDIPDEIFWILKGNCFSLYDSDTHRHISHSKCETFLRMWNKRRKALSELYTNKNMSVKRVPCRANLLTHSVLWPVALALFKDCKSFMRDISYSKGYYGLASSSKKFASSSFVFKYWIHNCVFSDSHLSATLFIRWKIKISSKDSSIYWRRADHKSFNVYTRRLKT